MDRKMKGKKLLKNFVEKAYWCMIAYFEKLKIIIDY